MSEMNFNEEKFTELVLYIAQSSLDDPDFGAIKMAKALWRSDFAAFAMYGQPITGASYMKLLNGPAPRQFPPVFEKMQQERLAEKVEQIVGGFESSRVVALRKANVEVFTARELALIHSVIDYVRDRTAMRLSQESHRVGWELSEMKETIPYEAALLPDEQPEPSERAVEVAQSVAASLSTIP